MWPKSPRIRRNELLAKHNSDASPRVNKGSPRAPYNKLALGTQLKKRRSQGHAQHSQKKLKEVGSSEKIPVVKIPRALMLTPASSDNSLCQMLEEPKLELIKNSKALSVSDLNGQLEPKTVPLPPYLTLKRQPTAAMLNFRARKSVSQMDFKEARRTGNYQLVVSKSQALVPTGQQANQLAGKDKGLGHMLLNDAAAQLCGQGRNLRFVVSEDQDVRIASLRIFNTIMLRSWRRRREEVRQLSEQLEDTKRSFVKNRNQLHVYNALFAVEKRRNDTLNDQLKQSFVESAKTKMSYNELSALLKQTKEEKQQLAEDNASKIQEIENLQELLQATKRELFLANTQQREHLEQLTRVQLECQDAKFDIEDLTGQLQSLKLELSQKQEYVEKLRDNIALIADQLKSSSDSFCEYKSDTEQHIRKLTKRAAELEKEVKEKTEQLVTLQNCLAATVGQRLRQCFAQSQPYQQATYRLMHLVACCMLPATPPPSLPMSTIPGAVSKIRGLFNTPTSGKTEAVADSRSLEK